MAIAACAGVVSPSRTHACSFAGPTPHTIDPAMVGVDQTPPNLPQPTVAKISRHDGTGCMGGDSCGDFVSVEITNLATDDMTPADKIGYRFAVVAGSGFTPPSGNVRTGNAGDTFWLLLNGYPDDIDFTLQMIAVDSAGNESAPQTVRVHDDVGLCSIGHRGPAGFATLAIVLMALMVAARRRRPIIVLLAMVVLVSPSRARACDPAFPVPHVVDPAMVGVDQTPPQLQQPTVAEIQHFDRGDGCVTPKCGSDNSVAITTPATDDMTPADRIGYRVTTVTGTAPAGLTPSGATAVAGGGTLLLFWNGDADVDFTVQLIAVDAAGNESLPQTVRVYNDTGGCRVGRGAPAGGLSIAIVALALTVALRRRPRPQRR